MLTCVCANCVERVYVFWLARPPHYLYCFQYKVSAEGTGSDPCSVEVGGLASQTNLCTVDRLLHWDNQVVYSRYLLC